VILFLIRRDTEKFHHCGFCEEFPCGHEEYLDGGEDTRNVLG